MAQQQPAPRTLPAAARCCRAATPLSQHPTPSCDRLRRLDVPAFYREARRLLKPHGVLAVWGYPLAQLQSPDHPADEVMQRVFDTTLGPYWDANRRILDAKYAGAWQLPCQLNRGASLCWVWDSGGGGASGEGGGGGGITHMALPQPPPAPLRACGCRC